MVVWQGRRPVYGPKRTIGDEADTVLAAGAAEHGDAVARRRWRLRTQSFAMLASLTTLSPPISLGTPARSGWTSWTIRTRSKRPRDFEPMTKLVKGCAAGGSPCRFAARQGDGDLFAVGSHEVEAARLAGGEVVFHRFGVDASGLEIIRRCRTSSATYCAMDGPARVWVQPTGGLVEVTVDDDGPGIRSQPRPCLRPFIAPNRPATIQLAGQALGLPLRSKRSRGSMIARSRSPLRQVAAPD
jgi:hypothetical protein